VQKRFTHIVNHVTGLGKTFDIDELNIKILKSLNRAWQPKVTAITESQNLATMTMAALFGKLREHELELGRLNEEEDIGRKKNIAFKTEVVKGKKQKEEEDSDDDENLSLMIKKFTKFMKAKGKNQFKSNKKDNQGSSSNFKCYGCGESGHVKADCPNSKKNEEKKGKKFFKKKAYIAWEDNASSSSNSNDSENEEANLCLMANHDDSDSEVNSTCHENDYDDLYDAFQQLLIKSSKLDTAHKKLKSDFKDLQSKFEKSLEEEEFLKNKISNLENKETVECASCKSYMFDICILEKHLADALENKNCEKFKIKKNPNKTKHAHNHSFKNKTKRTRRVWVEKGTYHSINTYACTTTCFYCMKKGHTSNKCNIKHLGVPNKKYIWVPVHK